MVVKKYSDGTYNIFYEKGDFVKIKDVSKYGEQENKNAENRTIKRGLRLFIAKDNLVFLA